MKKVILLSSVLLAAPFMFGEIGEAQAADCVTQDCPTLGYSSLSNSGNCVKCPFGNFWACPKIEEKAVLGQCTGYAKNCSVGQILNSDGTCTTNKESGKTPIGVVVYIGSDKCGYAMTASPIQRNIMWSSSYTTTGIGATTSWQTAIKNFDACANTQKIIQQGSSSEYPAAWAAVNYAPSAAPATKGKWCLPAPGMLNSLYTNLNAINNTISKLGGTQLTGDNEHIWSSSECSNRNAWVFCTHYSYGLNSFYKTGDDSNFVVRPVLAF